MNPSIGAALTAEWRGLSEKTLRPDRWHSPADGKKMIAPSDCNSYYLILAQGSGEQLKKLNADGYTFFHIDAEYTDFSCATCHTGGPQK